MEDSMGSLLYLSIPALALAFFLPRKKFFSKTRKNPCILEKEPVILFSKKGDNGFSRERRKHDDKGRSC
jgi:uncharacterized protein YneF (UPF0154 family)